MRIAYAVARGTRVVGSAPIAATRSQDTSCCRRPYKCFPWRKSVERAVRRATAISDIMAVTGRPFDKIAEIANAFRGPGRSFLMPPIDRELHEGAVLDISHESLIRQWDQMAVWVRTEAASAEQYREIEGRAHRRRDRVLGPASFSDLQGQGLQGIDLDVALAWRDRERPNRAWARRYGGDFDLAMNFLEQSRVQRDRINALRRARDASSFWPA